MVNGSWLAHAGNGRGTDLDDPSKMGLSALSSRKIGISYGVTAQFPLALPCTLLRTFELSL
jgi:hypothetical protein